MERLYRYFWRRKGDVYALLWDMQRSATAPTTTTITTTRQLQSSDRA